jgi:hypothetical protein
MHEKVCGCVLGKWLHFVVAGFLEVINYREMQPVAFWGWLHFVVQHMEMLSQPNSMNK